VVSDGVGLFIVNVDGTRLHRLAPRVADERHPRRSPDGQWLLHTASIGSGNRADTDIWCQSTNGATGYPVIRGAGRQEMGTWLTPGSR
jgi:Tol biopolymer transport system component